MAHKQCQDCRRHHSMEPELCACGERPRFSSSGVECMYCGAEERPRPEEFGAACAALRRWNDETRRARRFRVRVKGGK